MSHVFLDVDTQLDFLSPAGALYAPGAERIIPNLARLTTHAAQHAIPLLSTADAHTEADPEFDIYPHHCVKGALGQRKLACTVLSRGQHLIEKQSVDCFTNAALEPLLASLRPERVFVYGVVTDVCVMHAVQGLLQRNYQVGLVTDAVHAFDEQAAEKLTGSWRQAGVKFVTTAAICG